MQYNEYQEKVNGKFGGKIWRTIGWFLVIVGVLNGLNYGNRMLKWNKEKENYNMQYVYSNMGNLEYELNNEIIYIEKIYNTDYEEITLSIPEQKTIIMYCEKDNPSVGIYFDMNNSIDNGILNPMMNLIITFFIIGFGVFFIMFFRPNVTTSVKSLVLVATAAFLMGTMIFGSEVTSIIKYIDLKSKDNIIEATIYSEIYNGNENPNSENNKYKPVAHYYVDGEKYIYVDKYYINGTLDENLYSTIEMYYDDENPENALKVDNSINILMLIIGMFFMIFTAPFVFFRKKIEERNKKNQNKLKKEKEWKI